MKPTMISIHHPAEYQASINANPGEMLVNRIRNYHVKNLGWKDIGYHWVVNKDKNGVFKAYAGRPESWTGAHTWQNNSYTIGISVAYGMGTQPPEAQLQALAELIADICKRHNIAINRKNIKGHREFPYNAGNECPGQNLFEKLGYVVDLAKKVGEPQAAKPHPKQNDPQPEEDHISNIELRYGNGGKAEALLIDDSTYINMSVLKRMISDFGFPLEVTYIDPEGPAKHYVDIQRKKEVKP
jgi:hypothetical protein